MLQPRRRTLYFVCLVAVLIVAAAEGSEDTIDTTPRRKRDTNDVTTVLLVDSRGRSSFGRFLSVKPDLGLITSTARTFIQDGVTTEYATQVLGTTLDNGRLYAHLLTKSSRVLYDGDTAPSNSYNHNHKKWNLDKNAISDKHFPRNTEFIKPNHIEAALVFPTARPSSVVFIEAREPAEDEILKEEPSNNPRVAYEDAINKDNLLLQNNIKIFKINPQMRDLTHENIIDHRENVQLTPEIISASKVRPWDNLPTFTVRNEFSPSGFSYLGDLPDSDVNTERNKLTTLAERRAKLLFRAGFIKPEPKDLQTITYTGFADFTTTVGDTVIVFSPHTTEPIKSASVVTEVVKPTIKPTVTFRTSPSVGTKIKTFLSQEPPVETQTVEGHKLDMKTILPTMVIDKNDRSRYAKDDDGRREDMEAKSAVLAHEQNGGETSIVDKEDTSTILFTPDVITPSIPQTLMLSTPSDEDIAKIFAALQAQSKQATEPLNTPTTIFLDEVTSSTETPTKVSSGSTTIFFEDDSPIESTDVIEAPTTTNTPEQTESEEHTTPYVTTEQITEAHKEQTTTERQQTTTTTPTTTKEISTTSEETVQEKDITTNTIDLVDDDPVNTITLEDSTPEIISNEVDPEELDTPVSCTDGNKIVPTTTYKTLTYLTTFFIPEDDTTTTSIKSNEVVSTEIGFHTEPCDLITPSSVEEELATTLIAATTESEVTTSEPSDGGHITTEPLPTTTTDYETTPQEITTEVKHVTEFVSEAEDSTTESGEEIELIFKTLYTTYTYLTTYFQDTTSSIASKIVVTTNVITSTLLPGHEASESAVAGLFDRDDSTSAHKSKTITFEDFAEIAPTKLAGTEEATSLVDDLVQATPVLDDVKLLQTANGVKTYYTTYTYFTTIFVDGETEISSRTEVYTNYVTPSAHDASEDIVPTRLPSLLEAVPRQTDDDDDDEEEEEEEAEEDEIKQKILSLSVTPSNTYNSIITRRKSASSENPTTDKLHSTTPTLKEQAYVTLQRGGTTTSSESSLDNNLLDYETIATMVTDVRSSTSEGDRRIIDNVDKRNALLDDQIVSETNNESEIIPSPTLLLQTSYTTFTYFTTMYHGTTSSNVVSRLETVTNVVTETLTPTHTLSVEDLHLPITYFTTFTYWTTLYKDGTTKVTSREETVSNVVTPTPSLGSDLPTISITPTATSEDLASTQLTNDIQPSTVGDDDLTTYFTTYTYYTTSYVGNSTLLNSRLETVTNVLNSSADIGSNQIGRAIGTAVPNQLSAKVPSSSSSIQSTGLLSTIVNTVENSGTTTILSTDVFGTYIDGLYAKVLESTSSVITPTSTLQPSSELNIKPTGVVSINKGKIIDAEGISTLYYTTQAVGTYVDNLYAQIIESTSSLQVNEERKAALATDVPINHRTGLVRLIEGSIIQNDTTTLYQSKVLGTVIDGRYAQIIESTSSFLFGKSSSIKPSTASKIVPTQTKAPEQITSTTVPISPSSVVIESSLSDSSKIDEETSTEEIDEDGEDRDDGNSRVKSRLTFQTKKRTFTPAIRPFASRARPTFAPKRKGSGPATTVTRSDVTPTVTAVPASKSGRFGGRRNSSSSNLIVPTASGSRRFSRPKSSSAGGVSSSFGGGKRSSSRIQPTATGFGASTKRGGFRSSSGGASSPRASSLFGVNSRFRIRPTLASSLNRSPNSVTPAAIDNDENDLTTQVTDPTNAVDESIDTTLPLSTTTEGTSRRSQNPLLKLRRPPLGRPPTTPRTTTPKTAKNNKNRTTTTTAKPKVTYGRPNAALNRQRPNSLFPRRGLFTTTTTAATVEDDEDDLEEEGQNEDEDTDYESSQTNTQTAPPPAAEIRRGRSSSNTVQIKPFVGFRKRSKRETTYSRFRRPTRTTAAPTTEAEEVTKRTTNKAGRFRSRTQTTEATPVAPVTRKRISPSKSQSRSQFTLRENITPRSNYKRPTTSSRLRNSGTVASRPKAPKLRGQYQTESPVSNRKPTTSRTTSRGSRRGHTRGRTENYNVDDNYVVPKFDGTITVTHQIPTEVTIPVVSNGVTEYKNVITAKYSTVVLGPKQYTTSLNALGRDVTILASEATSIGDNGATLITQFVLNETPTTSIAFTPTYIRGRKTSFSHVIPSTAYGVEQVVNTIQPALAAQAPLANILLSQLLLGGLQQQNPLLALQNPGLGAVPTTETKTRATTYVTTVTSFTSTVIPLTFRGKEILTTIVDSSVNVFTATEFLTDTVVVTPTFNNQLNTLLLPLLQQQLAQPNPLVQSNPSPAGVFNIATDRPQAQALYQEPEKFNLALDDEEVEQEIEQEIKEPPRRKSTTRKKKPAPTPIEPPKETSIITLYVSGRTPGEFSTVLSTVVADENNRRKRQVQPSRRLDDLVISTLDYFDSHVMPGTKGPKLDGADIGETESLESVVGDVTKYVQTSAILNAKPTKLFNPAASEKYKINIVDLDETAPLMPKVETSLIRARGKPLQSTNMNVSRIIGVNRRRLNSTEGGSRRTVKKLVRVEPLSDRNATGRVRKRLVIRKKKKKQRPKSSLDLGAIMPQRRKTVVVTRKKLIPATAVEVMLNTASVDLDLENNSTEVDSNENKILPPDLPKDIPREELKTTVVNSTTVPEHVPDYEPFFPELSDSLAASVLLLKTTILSSVEFVTKTVLQSRLRTYTILVTRVNGDEQITTSTTDVRPQTKTVVLTESHTKFTTLTLLDFDVTSTLDPIPMTPVPAFPRLNTEDQQGRGFEEARYNLATRVMSNGVEVIIAGDRSTLPGEPNIRRILPSSVYKAVTLKPSTLSDHMMLLLPQDGSNVNSITALSNQFVTKTCLTTFTYLTTFLESGTTTVSSHEQVVSNVATEERNTGKILPTPAMGITLTQYPNLSVGVFHTTYTYLNTILDGEQPLVVTSAHTVTNTVTAPDDYLSLLQPSLDVSALRDTNTYYKTVSLEKTLYEDDTSKIISTDEVVTQVVITESVPPKATSVMTSYIALDIENPNPISINYTTTDVVKTYFVTYTYYHTLLSNGNKILQTSISTSSDVVTEKLYLQPKSTSAPIPSTEHDFQILATKTYHTTFTYFTTLLQENNTKSSTVISSRSKIIKNVITETIEPHSLKSDNLNEIQADLQNSDSITTTVDLNGQNVEITVIANKILPTKVLPIEKTELPHIVEVESSAPSVITGSTIIFIDDEPPSSSQTETPNLTKLTSSAKKTFAPNSKTRRPSKSKTRTQSVISPTKVLKKPSTVTAKPPTSHVTDLLGLGSININSIQALKPVFNAMAGLIKTNLKSSRRNDSVYVPTTTPQAAIKKANLSYEVQNRSPIYIPVGDLNDDFEIAESQNIATFHLQETVDWNGHKKSILLNKPTHESPLLNGGIPISPGEVITANSDVIVGKPGRIGPRIPSIPLNQVKDEDYGLKPPPLWPKKVHKHYDNNREKLPYKDDYVLNPPPLSDKHKQIPLQSPPEQVYAYAQNNYEPQYGTNQVRPDYKMSNVQDEIQKNYEYVLAKEPFPTYASGQLDNPMSKYNLLPSIVLPEIVERSTGQPLLVNIQPSQVAFINIPHNRTTALIYGGSTEAHRNGQYFDDPSPYPEPEFSGIESFNNGIPQFASVYHDNIFNQKQVAGIIKVDSQLPKATEHRPQLTIKPSRPTTHGNFLINNYQSHDINVNVPPISFGMVHKDNEFDGHVINHNDGQFNQPQAQETEEIIDLRPPVDKGPGYQIVDQPPAQISYHANDDRGSNLFDSLALYKPHKIKPPHKNTVVRPRPKPIEIAEYMTPPPLTSQLNFRQKPMHIPLVPDKFASYGDDEYAPYDDNVRSDQKYPNRYQGGGDDSDLINEDGEVIQESNSRPLRPGQVPFEILKAQTSTTTEGKIETIPTRAVHKVKVHRRPVISNPRPFSTVPFVRQENQQTNQVNVYDFDNRFVTTTAQSTTLHVKKHQRKPVSSAGNKMTSSTNTYSNGPEFNSQTNQWLSYPNLDHTDSPTSHYPQPNLTPRPTEATEHAFKSHRPSLSDLLNKEKNITPATVEAAILSTTDANILIKPPKPLRPVATQPRLNSSQELTQSTVPTSTTQIISQNVTYPHMTDLNTDLLPPFEDISNEEVVGMSPPPLVTTRDVITASSRPRPQTTRPYTRTRLRPTYATRVTTRRPVYSNYDSSRNRSTTRPPIQLSDTISPSPTIKNLPTMETIIGNPVDPSKNTQPVELGGDNNNSQTQIAESEVDLETTSSVTTSTSILQPSPSSSTFTTTSTKKDIINTAVHHAGNEIKVVDDDSSSVTSDVQTTKDTIKPVISTPTRYITYTKTSTVTITKTTIVKTLNGPPSTLTLLVTKTEKSTIIDTVTEFHTLVKPTSIVETITTTIPSPSLYPSNVYPQTYASTKIPPLTSVDESVTTETTTEKSNNNLKDTIVKDNKSQIVQQVPEQGNESILVVMTDKNRGGIIPDTSYETQSRDEVITNNEANNVLLGSIFISNIPSLEVPQVHGNKCEPECKASRNEFCQKIEGLMRCVCRLGFARMFPDRPCIPTYTYDLKINLERYGRENLQFGDELADSNSTEFAKFTTIIQDALDRMVMQSDLRDIYHGVRVHSYKPTNSTGIAAQFYLQLSDNTDENRLKGILKKYLRNNNYSIGGTELYAAKETTNSFEAQDFDECTNSKFHDCSENAQCFNLKGTYTCSCKEGYADLSENSLYPGRVCSAEIVGCEKCNYHGICYTRDDAQVLCECFHWYTGESCHINLKVLLIALVTIGAILLILLFICIVLACCRKRPKTIGMTTGMSFLPQRVDNLGTLDRRAMIQDTSSEDSRSERSVTLVEHKKKLKGALKKTSIQAETVASENTIKFPDQKDRSLTVMIPRAKYHSVPPTSPLINYTSFDARKPSVPPTNNNEAKLLSYLDAGPSPSKSEPKRKYSNNQSDTYSVEEKPSSRKTSGALVSAGFEVSATVLANKLGTLGTTCGTEADRSENATLIQKISTDLLSSTGTRSHYNSLRKSLVHDDMDPMANWLDITHRINTVSEARSFDETTVPPPMKSFRTDYDSKPSSQHQNDEANTMAERDLGSTFLLPHTHLYKPDRGSDISGFESL